MLKVKVDNEAMHTAADGNGPVNALDFALRKALLNFYPELKAVRLADYKVRVVDQGVETEAVVRVLIESADGQDSWSTVGSSGKRHRSKLDGSLRQPGVVARSKPSAISYQRSIVNLRHSEAVGEESVDGRTETPQRTTRCFVATQHDIGVP